ncbi:MAG: serine/threonine protein kinase, partial [Sandaracinus sp.]|nr:serine/threonine protein kinase [Sandaracinus sp.]
MADGRRGPLESEGGFSEETPPDEVSTDDEVTPRRGSSPSDAERYEDGLVVGRGAMGEVRAVLDRRLGRVVARKLARDDGPTAGRLAREASIVASLEHPGIVPLYDQGEGPDGRPWYTMRLVRGETLATVLAQTDDPNARLALVRRVTAAAQAVAAAHRAGVVHRDLKPANVMLGADGATLVVDWGLACRRGELEPADEGAPRTSEPRTSEPRLTHAGSVVGTLAYMSPEQARGERVDVRADVFALGAMLHEVITGELAFPRGPLEEGAPPRALASTPSELAAIVRRALAPLDQRYPDAGALVADLERFLDGRLVEAHEYTPLEHLVRFWRARRAWVLAATGALLAIVVTIAIAFARITAARDAAEVSEARAVRALARADESNARLLVRLAGEHARAGRRAEAEALLARAGGDDPEARGWRAALGDGRPRRVAERARPEGCVSFVARDGFLLCNGDDEVWLVDPDGRERWRVTTPARRSEVAFLGESSVLVHGGRLLELRREDGSTISDRPFLPLARGTLRGEGEGAVAALSASFAWWRGPGEEAIKLDPCFGKRPDAVALGPAGPVVACDTTLVRFEGTEVVSREDLGLGTLTSLQVDADDLLIGTRRGSVHRFADGETRVLRLDETTVLRVLPVGDWVAVELDGRGVMLWHPRTDAREALPTRELAIVEVHGGRLHTRSADMVRAWSTSAAAARHVTLGAGVSTIDGEDGALVAALGDGSVVAWDGRTGEELARASIADGVAKWARIVGDRVLAQPGPPIDHVDVLTLEGLLPEGRWQAPSCRRFALLGDRLVGASYGATLHELRPSGARPIAAASRHGSIEDLAEAATDLLWLGDSGEVVAVDENGARELFRAPGARTVAAMGEDVALGFSDHVERRSRRGVLRASVEVSSPVEDALPVRDLLATAHLDGTVRTFTDDLSLRSVHRAHD